MLCMDWGHLAVEAARTVTACIATPKTDQQGEGVKWTAKCVCKAGDTTGATEAGPAARSVGAPTVQL